MDVDTHILLSTAPSPQIADGFITDRSAAYHYGEQARVQCHRGFRLVGSPLITCGEDEEFLNPPTCEGEWCYMWCEL